MTVTPRDLRFRGLLNFGGNGVEILLKFQQVNLYNFLISTCGKCKSSDTAIKVSFLFVVSFHEFLVLQSFLIYVRKA